jgi:hypothetical protein
VAGFFHALFVSNFTIVFTFQVFWNKPRNNYSRIIRHGHFSRDNFSHLPPGVDQAKISSQALHFPRHARSPHVRDIPCKLKPCCGPNAGRPICFAHNYITSLSRWSWGPLFVASGSFQLKSTWFSCVPSA